MPSSRTCPAPTGPKLLIWTWVCECTTGPDCPQAAGRAEMGDSQTQARHCLLGQVPRLQTGCTLGACARQSSSNGERAEKRIKLRHKLLAYEIFGPENLKRPVAILLFCPHNSAWTRVWKRHDWGDSHCPAKDSWKKHQMPRVVLSAVFRLQRFIPRSFLNSEGLDYIYIFFLR